MAECADPEVLLNELYDYRDNLIANVGLGQEWATWGRKRIFCGREIVLQNALCGGRALIKMFCYVTVKNSYDLLTVTLIKTISYSNEKKQLSHS